MESQNPRVVWVGRDLKDISFQPLRHRQDATPRSACSEPHNNLIIPLVNLFFTPVLHLTLYNPKHTAREEYWDLISLWIHHKVLSMAFSILPATLWAGMGHLQLGGRWSSQGAFTVLVPPVQGAELLSMSSQQLPLSCHLWAVVIPGQWHSQHVHHTLWYKLTNKTDSSPFSNVGLSSQNNSTPSCFICELNPHQAFLYPYHRIILSASSTV